MNVSKLSPSVNRIEFDDNGRTTIVEFDDRHIIVSRKKWHIELGTSTRLLHQLSKTISPARTNDPSAAAEVRSSWLWLLGAVVTYFSSYNVGIPLLAPALGLVWLIKFSINIRAAIPKDWLAVNDDWGILVVQIRAPGGENGGSSRSEMFANTLSKAIETAKQKEYGLADKA
jgi:hypothetical protein